MERYLPLDTEALAIDWNTPLRGYNTPILFGLVTYDTVESGYSPLLGPNGRLEGREGDDRAGRRTFNSAFLLEPNGRVLGRYDKNHLLVFGEYLPFGDWFPQLYDMLPQANHFTPGDTVEPIDFQGHRLGVIICYEDILPAFTRNLAGKDPNVLINVTNDAWFGKTSEPALHLALSVFRSVEHRLWLIRSTNTGISAFVDGVGRIVAGTRLEDPEVLVRDVPMMRSSTIYRRYGDLFAYACLLVFSVLAVGGLARRARA
jgi:apolipoprotein N-acyltransferase